MSRSERLKRRWARFWMRFSGLSCSGRLAARLAAWTMPPYYGCVPLSRLNSNGFCSPTAKIHHAKLDIGEHCFIGDRVTIYQDREGDEVRLSNGVHLHNDTTIQTGQGGAINIGTNTHLQPRCQLSAYVGSISIGSGVEIAPNCAFYSYNHNMLPEIPIREQSLSSRGDIKIGDDAWLGYGVIILDGVNIGKGAVIGAGSVVKDDIPDNAIAVGIPARIVSNRNKLA